MSLYFLFGGAMGIRTPDLLNAIEALYQLSYDPKQFLGATNLVAKRLYCNFISRL